MLPKHKPSVVIISILNLMIFILRLDSLGLSKIGFEFRCG